VFGVGRLCRAENSLTVPEIDVTPNPDTGGDWLGWLLNRPEQVAACLYSFVVACIDNLKIALMPLVVAGVTIAIGSAIPAACALGPLGCGVAIAFIAPGVVAGTAGTLLLAQEVWFFDPGESPYHDLSAPWRD
jgi:hypothetical protein